MIQNEESSDEDDILGDDNDLIDETAIQSHNLKNATPDQLTAEKIDVSKIRRMSIRDEIVKQSSLYVDQLSILEKSKMLLKPSKHLQRIKHSVVLDKSSLLSCSGTIQNKSIQEKIARKSIRMIMPQADEKYFENSKALDQTYKSKL